MGLRLCLFACLFGLTGLFPARGQIDPVKRELFQAGYNAAFQGHPPLAAYAFYYHNQPGFLRTNLTLRLAVAPTYLDSELGIREVLTPHTDLGIGLAGGGFADSYAEIRQGEYLPKESFTGHGADLNLSLYHLFNPNQTIPLSGVLRGFSHYSFFDRDSETADNFQIPEDFATFGVRSGLRWGGQEPVLFPSLAMELSVWYESLFRSQSQVYGFNDRDLESNSQLIWAQALLAYTFPRIDHSFYVSLSAGTSIDADRFSAYRLGALLPMVSEFPRSLPGYYYQEISATDYVLIGGNYVIPLSSNHRWNIDVNATTAVVRYLKGLEQPGDWHSGVGAGLLYKSDSWRVMVGYAYGLDAIRSDGIGAHSLGILVQLDLTSAKEAFYRSDQPSRWRGFQRLLGVLGS